MKVLVIHHNSVLGGAERSILELLSRLKDSGVEAHMMLPGNGPLVKEIAKLGLPVVQVDLPKLKRTLNPMKLASYLSHRIKLSALAGQYVKEHGIEIVHFNSISGAVLFSDGLSKIVPTILHLRDSIVPKIAFRQFASDLSAYIAISEYMHEVLVSFLEAPPHKVFRILNGLALAGGVTAAERAKARKSFGFADTDVIFLSAAAFVPWKNHLSLFDAWKTVSNVHPEAKLVICGSDVTGENPDLAKKIEVLCHNASNCILAGQASDMRKYYAAADVFVHPAIGEPFGRAVAEAQAYGLPAVVFRSGAMPEIVEHEKTGLISGLDHSSFAENMEILASDPELRKKMGKSATSRAMKLFTVDRVAQQVLDLYRMILDNSLPSEPPRMPANQKELRKRRRNKLRKD
ncbi:MAG: hypothetical protein Kow00107_07620 [Planctomycetota bacterium]